MNYTSVDQTGNDIYSKWQSVVVGKYLPLTTHYLLLWARRQYSRYSNCHLLLTTIGNVVVSAAIMSEDAAEVG